MKMLIIQLKLKLDAQQRIIRGGVSKKKPKNNGKLSAILGWFTEGLETYCILFGL